MNTRVTAIRTDTRVRLALRIMLAIFAITVLGAFLGRLVVGPLQAWLLRDVDAPARLFAEHHESSTLTESATRVSPFGTVWGAGSVVTVVALGWWLCTRNARPALALVMAFVGALAVTFAVKYGVHRSPQSGPTSRFTAGTFPSGHTLVALAVYGTLAVLIVRANVRARLLRVLAALALLGLAVAVAGGRVYLLDHYLSDVIGSFILGVALIVASVGIVDSRPSPAELPPQVPAPVSSRGLVYLRGASSLIWVRFSKRARAGATTGQHRGAGLPRHDPSAAQSDEGDQ